MKYLFALALVIFGAQAWAADPPVNVGGTRCSPASSDAAARDAGIGPGLSGLWMSHWCKDVQGQWWLQISAVAVADSGSFAGMAHDWMAAINGSDYDAAMGAYRVKYGAQTGDPYSAKYKPIWYPSLASIMAAKPADATLPPPVTQAWVVKLNGLAKTRQWYAYDQATGVRSASGGGSVTILQADGSQTPCAAPYKLEGAVQYGAFGKVPNSARVTVCELK
ncbi:MAG: hypothetical protein ABI605_10810 [Rhizobacter sp.]